MPAVEEEDEQPIAADEAALPAAAEEDELPEAADDTAPELTEEELADRKKAARKIQAIQRGRQTRKVLDEKNS